MTEEPVHGMGRRLKPAEAADYIGGLIARHGFKCPVCTGSGFELANVSDTDGNMRPYQLIASLDPPQSFAAIPVVCTNCGHTSFFAHKTVREKIDGPKP